MRAVTLRIFRQDEPPRHAIELREGSPGESGAVLASAPVPSAPEVRAALAEIRGQLLRQTGRVPNIDAKGLELGGLLLAGDVGTIWTEKTAAALWDVTNWSRQRIEVLRDSKATEEQRRWAQDHPGLRTYFQIEIPDLESVPWELARAPATLFLQGDLPIVRYRTYRDGRAPNPQPEWQIRVLVVVAAENRLAIGAADEVRAICRALRPLDRIYDVDVLHDPDRVKLVARLRAFRPHILHFIGHGTGQSLQLFNGTVNIPWGAIEIANDIGPHSWVPEVAYLNACRSHNAEDWAAATPDDQTRQWGIVDALFSRGVLAVIAMQADVRGRAAGLCAEEFYRGLREGAPIDAAMARGRARIAQVVEGREGAREPYLPVLTVTVPADAILRHRSSTDETDCAFARQHLAQFVDRFEERRLLVGAIENQKHVVILQGAAEMGKTWLLSWAIDLCLRRRCAVRYVELGSCADWLEVLRALRDGNKQPGGVQAPLGPLLSPSFNWRLSHLAEGRVEPEGSPGAEERDKAGPWAKIKKSRKTPPDFAIHACKAFHEALRLDATKLVIVMDQLEAGDRGLSADQFALLREHWIHPFVVRGDGRVNVLLAIRSDRRRDYGLDPLPPDYGDVPVDQFRAADSKELLAELFRLRLEQESRVGPKPELAGMLEQMEQELAQYPDEAGTGKELQTWLVGLWETCRKKLKAKSNR